MKLPEICIRQPVLATVLSLVLVVIGIVCYNALELRFFPKIKIPIVQINASYSGASAKLMESQVTTLIENALGDLQNVQEVTSSSNQGSSSISVLFRQGGNFDDEANQVRDKIFGLRDQLPASMTTPTVSTGSNADSILGLGFMDKTKKPIEVRAYLEQVVMPQLHQIKGVGGVTVLGSYDFAMRIWLDPIKMASLGVTVTDVKSALLSNNISFPGGSFVTPTRAYGLVSNTQLDQPDKFENIIVRSTDAGTLRLKDIAEINFGNSSLYEAPLRINGVDGVELTIQPLQDANPIEVANLVKQKLTEIRAELPKGMTVGVNYDASIFLNSSIHETFIAVIEAIVLVILIVFLFLGSLRAASIPIVTIPVSLIGVFIILKMFGFTLNVMSLLAMVLAIGLVVDDAIVMLENIHRHIERGLSPFKAALKGSKEIAYPVLVMSLTLVAVYAPIGFMHGITSELFQEFAYTLAGAVMISAFVALTLSPMMCSKVLLVHQNENAYVRWLEKIFNVLNTRYRALLRFMLSYRHYVVLGLLLFAILGLGIAKLLPAETVPNEDEGVVKVSVVVPAGGNLDYTLANVTKVENAIKQLPSVSGVISQVWSNGTNIFVTLKPWKDRKITTAQVIQRLNQDFRQIPGVTAYAYLPDIAGYGENSGSSAVILNLMAPTSYNQLINSIDDVLKMLEQNPKLENITTSLNFNNQQYSITINRDLVASLGVNIQDIADTVSSMMSGGHWTDIQSDKRSYSVLVQMNKENIANFDVLANLYVRSATNKMIPVSEVVKLTPIVGQGTLTHFNRFRSASITMGLGAGYTEGQAIRYIQQNITAKLQPGVTYAFSGKAEEFLDSKGGLIGLFILSVIFIYLVLSAQFGSFIDPLIILVAIPLSIVGALLPLWLTGSSLTLYANIGFLTLIGLVSKHGILITQFINEQRQQGVEFYEAIVNAATVRLRPILMTTAAMVFGTLPLAFATGPGSIGRSEIGWVIVGGLLFGTFFSLIVVPIAYSYLGKFKKILKAD